MKMKFGALVVDGRGKIGGHVASKNRAGAYLRTKVTPVNPQTAFQNTARARLTTLSQAWRDLTQDQRNAWNSAVLDFQKTDIFGDLKSPTGFNLYVRLNSNLDAIGAAAIDEPPLPSAVPTVDIGALTIDVGLGDTATLATSGAVPAGTAMQVWLTPGVSAGVNFVKSEYRLLQVFAAAAGSPHDIQAAQVARFGTPAEGTKVFAKIVFTNILTGQNSTQQSVSTIVVST